MLVFGIVALLIVVMSVSHDRSKQRRLRDSRRAYTRVTRNGRGR